MNFLGKVYSKEMYKKSHSIKFNAVMNFVLSASSVLFPLITFPYISRVLLVEANGRQAFAYSVIQYFVMFASLGVPTYGIRACAQVRDDRKKLSRTFQELFIINIVTTVLTYLVFAWSLFVVQKFQEERTLLLINSFAIILNSIGVNWLYQALEEYSYITIRNIAFKFVALILMFSFVHNPSDLNTYAVIVVIGTFGSNILNFVRLFKTIDCKVLVPYSFKKHFKPIFIFFATSAATSVYYSLSTSMLGFMSNSTQVGLFDASSKIKNILILVVSALGNVLLPRMSLYVQEGKIGEYRRLIVKAFDYVLCVSLAIIGFGVIYSREIVSFLCGEAYSEASKSLVVLLPALIFIGLSQTTGMQMLVPNGKESVVLVSTVLGAVVDLVANVLLLNPLGAFGAAIGVSIAEFVVMIYQMIVLRTEMGFLIKKISILPICASCVVTILVTLVVHTFVVTNTFLSLLVGGTVFCGVYLGCLLLLRVSIAQDMLSFIFKQK